MELMIGFAGGILLVLFLVFRGRKPRRIGLDAPEAPAPSAPSGATSRGAEDIEAALAGGRLIEAIKIYREVHGVGLKKAKEAVEAMQAGNARDVPMRDGVPDILEMLDDDVRYQMHYELSEGNRIAAIRLVRDATGLGLKDAKDGVEAMEARGDG